MKHTDDTDILTRARQAGLATPRAGMEVPQGYFERFNATFPATLPYRAEAEATQPEEKSLWKKVRPYVYMAAMFAGIWLMLQVFAGIAAPGQLAPMDDNPILAEALDNDEFLFDYYLDDITTYDLYDHFAEGDSVGIPPIFDEDGTDPSCQFSSNQFTEE